MAKLYVTEFESIFLSGGQSVAVTPPIFDQTPLAIGASSVASAAFNAKTGLVRIETDAICSLAWGATPVATANNMRMNANTVEYFAVQAGAKVAVITNT
jgi:orotate phosphoribosyltransferase